MRKTLSIAALGLLFLNACSSDSGTESTPAEPAYCSTTLSYANAATVSGKAVYQRRQLTSTGLGAVDTTSYPVRFAEVVVTENTNLQTLQCGTTDTNGNFSLQVPKSSSSYTVSISSRAFNSHLQVSVLDTPTTNAVYSIKKEFTPMANVNVGTLTAPAKNTLEGGAFNIYDQILKANEFLKNQTVACGSSFTGCIPFSVAPKVTVYWKAGVNPGTYFDVDSAISFFHEGTGALYILGGKDGDIDFQDTDHFDNSVIVHEYGHFLVHSYSASDSPGGSHDANSIIDPRLAWDEGWANFFSLAVTGDPTYIDTYGNIDGATGTFFYHDLETNTPVRDVPSLAGEGNFREFSITRALWDMIDPHPVSGAGTNEATIDDVTATFGELWTVLTASNQFKNSSHNFRNYGLFMHLHSLLAGATDFSTVFTAEKQKASQDDYAADYTTGGSCTYAMSTTGAGEDGSFENSNQFDSNDFYQINHGGGNLNIALNRTAGTGDLDLYLYNSDYVFGDSTHIVAKSADPTPGDGGTELISKNLPAGHYMINVLLYTEGTAESASYKLLVNGAELCP